MCDISCNNVNFFFKAVKFKQNIYIIWVSPCGTTGWHQDWPIFNFLFTKFYLFVAVLRLHCRAGSLAVVTWSHSPVAVCGLLAAVASAAVERGLSEAQPYVVGARELSSCGSRLQGTGQHLWHPGFVAPRHVGSSVSGIEPVSPALAGVLFTTSHEKSPSNFLDPYIIQQSAILTWLISMHYF